MKKANCGHAPIYIGCLPRSGSTLLRNMLDSHPQIAGDRELFWPKTPNPTKTLEDSYKRVVKSGQRFLIKDAMVMHIDYITKLRALLGEDFYFILIKRNPYDSLISYAKTDTVHNFDLYAPKFIKAYKFIRDHNWHGSKYMEVSYEDLVANPEKSMRNICQFVRIPFKEDMLHHHKLTDTRRKFMIDHHSEHTATKPLFSSSVGQYEKYIEKTGFKPSPKQLEYCKIISELLGYS